MGPSAAVHTPSTERVDRVRTWTGEGAFEAETVDVYTDLVRTDTGWISTERHSRTRYCLSERRPRPRVSYRRLEQVTVGKTITFRY